MDAAWLVASSVKAAVLLAAAGLGAVVMRRGTPAARHRIWALGVMAALVVPVLSGILPSLVSVGPPVLGTGRSLDGAAFYITADDAGGAHAAWPWLAMVWASGVLLLAVRLLRGQLAAGRLARRSEPARAESWLVARAEAAAALGMVDDVELRRSELIESPMTIGVLPPRVLLPAAADTWSAERLRAVLLHELGHVRRHDIVIQLAAQIACALYWWNPLAWLAAARLRIEREHACDDLVLGAGTRPSVYAADLLLLSQAIAYDTAGACMADRSRIEVRLRRVLDVAAPRGPLGLGFRLAAGGVALACAVTVACTSASASLPARDEAPGADVSIGTPYIEHGPRAELFQPPMLLAEDGGYLSLVTMEVTRNAPELKRCFERRRAVHPELAGDVVIHWTISADGTVPDYCITRDTVGDVELVECVNQLVAAGRFPAPGAPVSVTFPFVFR